MNDTPPRIDPLLEERQKEFQRLHSLADRTTSASGFVLVVSLLAMLFLFVVTGPASLVFLAAAAFFLVSLVYLIVAQLMHIRATLERID